MHIIDIETIALPDDQLAALKPTFEPPANYKDPAKIAENLAAQEAKWKEQAALSAITGRVAIIGLLDNLGGFTASIANEPEQEINILRSFWADYAPHHVLGWNIKGFDIPFLVQRSWIHGIRVPDNVFNGRFISADWATDLLERWTCFQSRLQTGSSLDAVSRACGLGGKASTGAEFGKLWATNREQALDYCQTDCNLTWLLAKRLGAM